jgi:hypothetical protein
MKKYFMNFLKPDYESRLAAILGDDWRERAHLDKNLSPFAGREMQYYRTGDGLYFRLLISSSGLHALEVYDSLLAFEVASCPVKYKADFREQFEYVPDEAALSEQIEILLDFWQTSLKLDLSKPLVIKRPSLGDLMEVEYAGSEIIRDKKRIFRAIIKLKEIEFSGEHRFDIIMFTPHWSEIIPRQRPAKQLALFA